MFLGQTYYWVCSSSGILQIYLGRKAKNEDETSQSWRTSRNLFKYILLQKMCIKKASDRNATFMKIIVRKTTISIRRFNFWILNFFFGY